MLQLWVKYRHVNLSLVGLQALDAQDRGNLLDDAFSLAESGHLDYSVALALTQFLSREDHFVVWTLASSHLLAIDTHLFYTPVYSEYRVSFQINNNKFHSFQLHLEW